VPFPSGQKGTALLMPKDFEVRNGLRYDLALYDGHSNDLSEKNLLCKSVSHRLFLAENVRRIEVRENGLVGTLFLPNSTKKLPVVIDLYGTRGGLLEFRAALLSSHGFATFAVAYFDFEDLLPKKIKEVDMTYFLKVVDWLKAHPNIDPRGIGAIGTSLGADVAINIAIRRPNDLQAVVGINPSHVMDPFNQMLDNGVPMPVVEMNYADHIAFDKMGRLHYANVRRKMICDGAKHVYPIEKSNARFLFHCGEEDTFLSIESANCLAGRLKAAGKGANVQVVTHPGAGHLLEPPYKPFSEASFHRLIGVDFLWGGRMVEHSYAQEQMWWQSIEFFRENFFEGSSSRKAKL